MRRLLSLAVQMELLVGLLMANVGAVVSGELLAHSVAAGDAVRVHHVVLSHLWRLEEVDLIHDVLVNALSTKGPVAFLVLIAFDLKV